MALGGHRIGGYNYGTSGSINGLGAVWDSWTDHFMSATSNTTSLIVLLDERDFLKQNLTRSQTYVKLRSRNKLPFLFHACFLLLPASFPPLHRLTLWICHFFPAQSSYTYVFSNYLDSIFIDNLGLKPVDCVVQRRTHASRLKTSPVSDAPSGGRRHLQEALDNHLRRPKNHNRPHGMHDTSFGIDRSGASPVGRNTRPTTCKGHTLAVDSGYQVYYYDTALAASAQRLGGKHEPFIVFAAVQTFPKPAWAANEDEDTLEVHWRPFRLPKRFNTNYAYTKLTNWYSHHMLSLRLLDYFDYGGKIDNDVSFLQAFPESNLPERMARRGSLALATQQEWYHDDPRVAYGVRECLWNFMDSESQLCKNEKTSASNTKIQLHAAGRNDPTFWHERNLNCTFRSHFMTFWLGLYASPEVHLLSKHWNDWHPHGMWDYRWGDQQWWPRPIAMFTNKSLTITIDRYTLLDSDNDLYVKHKEYPRSATLKDVVYVNPASPVSRSEREIAYKKAAKKYIY